jgi:hypothetical protein
MYDKNANSNKVGGVLGLAIIIHTNLSSKILHFKMNTVAMNEEYMKYILLNVNKYD